MWVGTVALLAAGVGGCGRVPELPWRKAKNTVESPAAVTFGPAPRLESPDLCALEIERLSALDDSSGAPGFEARRAEILGRARATPRLFSRAPKATEGLPRELLPLWSQLESDADDPGPAISDLLKKTRRDLPLRRALFLREGYLYSEHPFTALRLSQMLRLDHLFNEPEVWVERRGQRLSAMRDEGRYWFVRADGTKDEAHLLFLDRVSLPGEGWGAPLHLDLELLATELGTARIHVERFTEEGHVVRLEYEGDHAPISTKAILVTDEFGDARLSCESLPRESWDAVANAKKAAQHQRALVRPMLTAIGQMVEWALPFDEPKTEEGQQDGKLRVEFRHAYLRGSSTYEFNGDKYFVFDGLGRPRLPQVCIDFITDTLDWATGGSWAPRGQGRVRTKGALHFASFNMENSRSVEQIAEFATQHPEWFDVVWLEANERVPLYRRPEFFGTLAKTWSRYRVGDIVFINGLRSDERFHYHSFFIVERDPVSGMPILLAANAGRPQLRTWEGEMVSAPRRYLVARVRVKTALLERAYEQAARAPGVPLELGPADTAVD